MDELQEQFAKTLEKLTEEAKTKKNVLTYKEVNDAFTGMQISEEKMDMILEYL